MSERRGTRAGLAEAIDPFAGGGAGNSPTGRAGQLAGTLLLAVLGYVTTALQTLRAQQHRARVDRVNEQLKSLYGPLLACVTASKSSYNAMLRQAGVESAEQMRDAVRMDPLGPAAHSYRRWVRTVLLPLSEQASQTFIRHADLLEGSQISPLLLQLVAHVSAYRVIERNWDEREAKGAEHAIGSHFSAIPYPDDLERWVSEGFDKLKRRQASLLGIAADGTQGSPLMRLIASRL